MLRRNGHARCYEPIARSARRIRSRSRVVACRRESRVSCRLRAAGPGRDAKAPASVRGADRCRRRRAVELDATGTRWRRPCRAAGPAGCAKGGATPCSAWATPQADWLIVGEAPGENEDLQGEPFVGQAGKLLDNMLKAAGTGPAAARSTSPTCSSAGRRATATRSPRKWRSASRSCAARSQLLQPQDHPGHGALRRAVAAGQQRAHRQAARPRPPATSACRWW